MSNLQYILYIAVMAGVTYLIRMLPMTLVQTKIKSTFFKSFIYYVPYAVLSAMTVPAIFYSTPDMLPSILGFAVAIIAAFFKASLLTVALSACSAVLLAQILFIFI